VRPCVWKRVPWLARLQIRPTNALALSAGSLHQIDADLTAIVEEIDAALERVVKEEEPPVKPPAPSVGISASTFRNSIGMEFLLIPRGKYCMGAKDGGVFDDRCPLHGVRITCPFHLGKYPVTQGQWKEVMGNNPSYFKGDPNLPVETVSWDDAQEFLRRLS